MKEQRQHFERVNKITFSTYALMVQTLVCVVRGVIEQREAKVVLRQVALRRGQLLAAGVGAVLARRSVRRRCAVRHVRLLVQPEIGFGLLVSVIT